MNIGHYQLECTPGDFEQNKAKVLRGLAVAQEKSIEIISFPESFLTGFFTEEAEARRHSFASDSVEIVGLLRDTTNFDATWMVGFNEMRDGKLFNTVLVAERGSILGTYSKAFPEPYFTPGREFPIFERCGIKFGVIICADGGYIEPARILALKGAKIIFAPHYNYIAAPHLINHFQQVRSDHIARAVENGVWFLRGNNVVFGQDRGLNYEGVGYGDSYLIDPKGEFVTLGRRHTECLIAADIDCDRDFSVNYNRSLKSAQALGGILFETVAQK